MLIYRYDCIFIEFGTSQKNDINIYLNEVFSN